MHNLSRSRRYCSAIALVLAIAHVGCSSDDDHEKTPDPPAACTFDSEGLLPTPTGTYCIGAKELNLRSDRTDPLSPDKKRKREVAVRIYYPASAAAKGEPLPYLDETTLEREEETLSSVPGIGAFLKRVKTHSIVAATVASLPKQKVVANAETTVATKNGFPVLVYSPGWGGLHQNMTSLLEDLASHGYVVVALNHPYVSGAVKLSDGTVVKPPPEELMTDATLGEHFRAVRSDIAFAIDQLESMKKENQESFAEKLDLGRIGLLGHSLGGGASVVSLAKDARVDAGVDIDGSITFGTEESPATDKPMLLMLAGDHPLSTDSEVAALWANHTGDAYRLDIAQANHVSFIDYGYLAEVLFSEPAPPEVFGAIDPSYMIALERKTIRTFFGDALANESAEELLKLSESGKVIVTARDGDPWLLPPENTAKYITMRDGVRIAVDLWLPADASESKQYPTLIRATRYWRDLGVTDPSYRDQTGSAEEAKFWVSQGYAVVLVDARGSGASFGTRAHPWSAAEVKDYGQVVDYIVQQPWSNGKVGAFGISYEGNTAALIGLQNKPAVKAVIPQYSDMDVFTDIAAPGGVPNVGFVTAWMKSNLAQDRNDLCTAVGLSVAECAETKQVITGVKPVDEDIDSALLRAAIVEHETSPDQLGPFSNLESKDDVFNGATLEQLSPARRTDLKGWGDTAVTFWASWTDAGTARGALEQFRASTGPMTVIIGAFSHGGDFDTDPFNSADAPLAISVAQQRDMMTLQFGAKMGVLPYELPARIVQYYTLGKSGFSTSDTWPPVGSKNTPFYLHSGGQLSTNSPGEAEPSDSYSVDFSATTGMANRWWTQMGGPDVVYEDRAAEDKKLVVFETTPLSADLLMTGTPEVTLQLASTHEDGAVFVYLEDVAPDGKVTYVTEGQLRLHFRAISAGAPAGQLGPYHSFRKSDGAPMVPGVSEPIRIGLEPTSVLFKANHRVRLAIAGHDASCFKRIPAEGNPVWTIFHQASLVSTLELPVMPNE